MATAFASNTSPPSTGTTFAAAGRPFKCLSYSLCGDASTRVEEASSRWRAPVVVPLQEQPRVCRVVRVRWDAITGSVAVDDAAIGA